MSSINTPPIIRKDDWNSAVEFSKKTRQALQQLSHLRLGVDSSPTFESLTLKGLTDHSLLVGSSPITSLMAATDGQLPIGGTGADPVIAALTGTTDRLLVTNGAGSITLDLGAHTQTLLDAFNGTFLETIDFTISEAGGTVTGSLEKDGGGNLTQRFSDGYSTLDCTPAKTINLTGYVGSNAVPKEVFVYILQSGKTTIAASNSDWPAAEHVKVANLVLKSATTTGTDGGALGNRNWNDHAQDANSQGHITDIEKRIRQEPTQHDSGIALTLKNSAGNALTTGNSSTAVEIVTSIGAVYQLHKHTFPAFDMYTTATDKAQVVNQPTDEGGAYETTVALVTDITHYVDGSAAGVAIGTNKYFNLVIWGIQNRTGEVSHVMINLPTGQYTVSANAVSDIDGTSVYDIPSVLKGLGFLIARLTFRLIAGAQWTYIAQEDLRGQFPNVSAGVGVNTTDHALLANLAFASAGHTGFQAQGDVLDDLNTLGTPVSDGQFIVATGAGAFAYEATTVARTSLGIGEGDTPTLASLVLGADPSVISSAHEIDIKPNGGADYIRVGISGGDLIISSIGGGTLNILSDNGEIDFGDENLTTTGILDVNVADITLLATIGNLTLSNGQIIDSGGAISFGNENLTTLGNIECNELTLTAPTGGWLATGSFSDLSWQSQTAATAARFQIYSNDGDETDSIFFEVYTDGSPGSLSQSQWMRMGWNADFGGFFHIQVGKQAGGDDRDFKIEATGIIEIDATGVLKLEGSQVGSTTIRDDTTATAENVNISTGSGGPIRRSTSSKRYKTIDSDMTIEKAACVLNLTPKKFYSKCRGDDPEKVFYGLIAEDVAEQFPEAAVLGEQGQVEAYDKNFLVAAMIKQIQVQDEKIEMLEDNQGIK